MLLISYFTCITHVQACARHTHATQKGIIIPYYFKVIKFNQGAGRFSPASVAQHRLLFGILF